MPGTGSDPGVLNVCTKMMDIRFHSSVIFCNDLQKQQEFYEKFLGQKIVRDLGGCLVFEGGFTLWRLEEEFPVSSEMGYTYEPIGNRNLELYFETGTFEDAVENILTGDLRMLHNVTEEKWGQYTIRFYDPEGNLVEIGESMKCMVARMRGSGMDAHAIAEKTGLDHDYVDHLLGQPGNDE